ncbi:glycoside hydrolase family 13 protein [Streptomyces sparsogenes]|uniref:glycoside hydrolase family 13 protein n=1 Tax=Streptomyces sparsogenes TaxID=67365 RepID=UPI0033F6AF83
MSAQEATPWWRDAVIYQVYPRSFADGNGDGIGDIAGIRARLPYLSELGVDAVWISPWYRSPMVDGGYDVADYRDIDPLFGTLAEAEALIREAHALGLRIIVDMVPNHCSDQHHWFQAALKSGPGSPERQRFHFLDGKGRAGEEPPNNWMAGFGGSAWKRVVAADGTPGQWYLHLFTAEQPDFNWNHPDVRAEFESILRFWLDRGIDGFRIDMANLLIKQEGLPDRPSMAPDSPSPYEDRPEVHEIYRAWRRIANSYEGDRVFVGELWVGPQSLARYLRPDELHTGFNFGYMQAPWDAARLKAVIDETLAQHTAIDAPATWVLGNHDITRVVTRYGRSDSSFAPGGVRVHNAPVDLQLGTRRARAAALLYLALPGSAYVYQGEELGLWEVEDIPAELRQDPTLAQSGGTDPGRDGCRVPLPWESAAPGFGFTPHDAAAAPWLPQPAAWRERAVDAQEGDPRSMLGLYRDALRIRRAETGLRAGGLTWLPGDESVLAFTRGDRFVCVANLGQSAVPLPAHSDVLLASTATPDALLPPDATAWLRL